MKKRSKNNFYVMDYLENGGKIEDVKKTSKHYNDIYKLYKTRTIMDLIYKSDKNLKLIFDFLILKNKDLVIGDLENIDLFATLDKYPVKDIISLLQQCK